MSRWTAITLDWRDWKHCIGRLTYADGSVYRCWGQASCALDGEPCCLEHAHERAAALGIEPPPIEGAMWWDTRYNRFPGVCSRCTNFGYWALMDGERTIVRYCDDCAPGAIERLKLPPLPPSA